MKREQLLGFSVKQLTKMNLSVLVSNVDYRGSKPDLVVVYPEKEKYYLTEVIAEDCFFSPSYRFKTIGFDAASREFCRKKYSNEREGIWAAAIYCDLGQGMELFGYTELKNYRFDKMGKYASIIYPSSLNQEAESIFSKFNLVYRSIDISNVFTMTLFSQHDSSKLAEGRRFMHFLENNKK